MALAEFWGLTPFQQASLLEEGIPGGITDLSNRAAEKLWKNIMHYSATYQVWELVVEVKATKVGSFQIVEKLRNNPGKSFSCVLQGVNKYEWHQIKINMTWQVIRHGCQVREISKSMLQHSVLVRPVYSMFCCRLILFYWIWNAYAKPDENIYLPGSCPCVWGAWKNSLNRGCILLHYPLWGIRSHGLDGSFKLASKEEGLSSQDWP